MKKKFDSTKSLKLAVNQHYKEEFGNKQIELRMQKNMENIHKVQSGLMSLDCTNFDKFINELTLLMKDLGVAALELRPYYPEVTKIGIDQASRIVDFCHKKNREQIKRICKVFANLIHCLDQKSQEDSLQQINIACKSLQQDEKHFILIYLASFLNLNSRLLELLNDTALKENEKTEPENQNIVGTKCQTFVDLEDIINCKSSKKMRLLLANFRRVDPCKSLEKTLLEKKAYYLRVFRELCKDFSSDHLLKNQKILFCKICLLAKFTILRKELFNQYVHLRATFNKLPPDYELIFLANSGLNLLLASKLRLFYGTDLIKIAQAGYSNELSKHFENLLKTRVVNSQNIAGNNKNSVAIVLATTDDCQKEEFFILSLASIILQSLEPVEIFVFVDPIKEDKTYQNKLKLLSNIEDYCKNASLDKTIAKALVSTASIKKHIFINDHIKGQYYARNKAAELTSCKYIANQDDDDISSYERIQKQIKCIENGGLAIYSSHLRISLNSLYQHDSRQYDFKGDGIASLLTYTDIVKRHPFLDVRSRADVEFRERLKKMYGSKCIHHMPEVLLLMRGASDTVSNKFETDRSVAFEFFYDSIAKSVFS